MPFKMSEDPYLPTPYGRDWPEKITSRLFEIYRDILLASQPRSRWDDMRAPAQSINPAGPVAAPTWDTTNIGLAFSGTQDNAVQIILQFPHGYVEGSTISPHLHISALGALAGRNSVWRMTWRWYNVDQVPGAFTTDTVTFATPSTAAHTIIPFADISGVVGGVTMLISSIFECTIYRLATNASDNYTADIILKEFDIHYQNDTLGSEAEFIKD